MLLVFLVDVRDNLIPLLPQTIHRQQLVASFGRGLKHHTGSRSIIIEWIIESH